MTDKQKLKLLKKMKYGPMTRSEIEPFCSEKDRLSKDKEISELINDNLIQMISNPVYRKGYFVPTGDDKYTLSDKGKNRIASIAKDNFRFWFPIVISIIALIFSAIALFMPEVYIIEQ